MIRVLIVDDSPVARKYLEYLLLTDAKLQVIGQVANGEEALAFLQCDKPDVITMDIEMPRMNGFDATRRIMETTPVPIVIVSANWNPTEVEKSFRPLQAGAVAILAKPPGPGHPDFEQLTTELIKTVKLMAGVPVVKRWAKSSTVKQAPPTEMAAPATPCRCEIAVVAIGASTGGPPALQILLSGLPTTFAVPILVVQHIAAGFIPGMAEWLARATGLPVTVAVHGERPLPGHVYLAPDACHMELAHNGTITLVDAPPDNGLRPSVAHLFRSVADHVGAPAIGVLLTGMGQDGAAELKLMHDRGAVTLAQDKASSVVHGMPGVAIKLGAATYVQAPAEIAATLIKLVRA